MSRGPRIHYTIVGTSCAQRLQCRAVTGFRSCERHVEGAHVCTVCLDRRIGGCNPLVHIGSPRSFNFRIQHHAVSSGFSLLDYPRTLNPLNPATYLAQNQPHHTRHLQSPTPKLRNIHPSTHTRRQNVHIHPPQVTRGKPRSIQVRHVHHLPHRLDVLFRNEPRRPLQRPRLLAHDRTIPQDPARQGRNRPRTVTDAHG